MSQPQARAAGQRTQKANREMTAASQQTQQLQSVQRPQDPKQAQTFDRNVKEASKIVKQLNKQSTQLGKRSATGAKAMQGAEKKLVEKEIGKHIQQMDKGGTALEKEVLKLEKMLKAPPKGKGKPASKADEKKAVQLSQDLVKKLKLLAAEMNAVDKEVVSQFAK
jgi:hypothetical protein